MNNQTTDEKYDKWFAEAHAAGVERHGMLWMAANEYVAVKAMRAGVAVSTRQNRALLSIVVLGALDCAQRYYEKKKEVA